MFFQNSNTNSIYHIVCVCSLLFFSPMGYSEPGSSATPPSNNLLSEKFANPDPDDCQYGSKNLISIQYNEEVLNEKRDRVISAIQEVQRANKSRIAFISQNSQFIGFNNREQEEGIEKVRRQENHRQNSNIENCIYQYDTTFSIGGHYHYNFRDTTDIKRIFSACNLELIARACMEEKEKSLEVVCGNDENQGCNGGYSKMIEEIKKEYSVSSSQDSQSLVPTYREKQNNIEQVQIGDQCKRMFSNLKGQGLLQRCTSKAFDNFFNNGAIINLAKKNCSKKAISDYVDMIHNMMSQQVAVHYQSIFNSEYQKRACHKKLGKIKEDLGQIISLIEGTAYQSAGVTGEPPPSP